MKIARDNYCIRHDYISRPASVPDAHELDTQYWNPYRTCMAKYYQYHVYLYGKELIVEKGLQSVLDIGCGPAWKLKTLIAPVCNDIIGLDRASIIEYCKQRFDFAQFISYDIEKETFPLKKTFDLIICADVVEHLADPDKLLEDIRSAAHYGTIVLFSTPDRDAMRGKDCLYSPNREHVREWNSGEFANYLESRGFTLLDHKLVPPMRFNWSKRYFAVWWRQRGNSRKFSFCQIAVCKKRPR
jgi:SAM-dependent methyltransferase